MSDTPPLPNQPPLSDEELAQHLAILIAGSPTVMRVLETVRDQGLPDWRLFSGAVYQTVWNALTEREPDHGIKDYDIGYFDADTSWDGEDIYIKKVAQALEPSLSAKVEVRNQARVHIWFPEKFGEAYSPLTRTDEALARFICPAFAVGVRLEDDDALTISAPFGLQDVFTMRLRKNPTRAISDQAFERVVASARNRWPELQSVE